MKIGIIGPTESEIFPFIDEMSDVYVERRAKLDFHIGKYAGIDIVAVCSGICKVNAAIAAQIIIDGFNAAQVFITGAAGAIDHNLSICDTVIVSQSAYHDVSDIVLTKYHPFMKTVWFNADATLAKDILGAVKGTEHEKSVFIGRAVTGETFIDQDGRPEIIEKFDPMCVDEETTAVAHVCFVNSVPFAAIRSMSDTPNESGIDVAHKYFAAASDKSLAVLKIYLNVYAKKI
jgi:adenosylhomocysteine nucleosidase